VGREKLKREKEGATLEGKKKVTGRDNQLIPHRGVVLVTKKRPDEDVSQGDIFGKPLKAEQNPKFARRPHSQKGRKPEAP